MSEYDSFLDRCVDEYYEDLEGLEIPFDDEPAIEPSTDYDNYDGWDDMQ